MILLSLLDERARSELGPKEVHPHEDAVREKIYVTKKAQPFQAVHVQQCYVKAKRKEE